MPHNPKTHWEPDMPKHQVLKINNNIVEEHTIVRVVAPVTEGNDKGFRYARLEDLIEGEYELYEGPQWHELQQQEQKEPQELAAIEDNSKGSKKGAAKADEKGGWGDPDA